MTDETRTPGVRIPFPPVTPEQREYLAKMHDAIVRPGDPRLNTIIGPVPDYQMSDECKRDIEVIRQATIYTPEKTIVTLTARIADLERDLAVERDALRLDVARAREDGIRAAAAACAREAIEQQEAAGAGALMNISFAVAAAGCRVCEEAVLALLAPAASSPDTGDTP